MAEKVKPNALLFNKDLARDREPSFAERKRQREAAQLERLRKMLRKQGVKLDG